MLVSVSVFLVLQRTMRLLRLALSNVEVRLRNVTLVFNDDFFPESSLRVYDHDFVVYKAWFVSRQKIISDDSQREKAVHHCADEPKNNFTILRFFLDLDGDSRILS